MRFFGFVFMQTVRDEAESTVCQIKKSECCEDRTAALNTASEFMEVLGALG